MTEILTPLINQDIDYKYSQIFVPFKVESDILKCTIVVPKGFIHDYESVPLIKGTSKSGGVVHDYLCRIDSVPVVTKKVAADVYLEIMKYRCNSWWRRWLKYGVVRVWPGYFHKHTVEATYEEMSGKKGDS